MIISTKNIEKILENLPIHNKMNDIYRLFNNGIEYHLSICEQGKPRNKDK